MRLPPELDRLGAHLEAAALAELERRERRRALRQVWWSGVIAAPVVCVLLASPLAVPGEAPVRVSSLVVALQPPTTAFNVRHIPDERVPFGTPVEAPARRAFPGRAA